MPSNQIEHSIPRKLVARRRGATSVEFALIAIPLFTFVFASLEFGHAMMVVQSVEEAARCGCRTASLRGMSSTDVETSVDDVMRTFGITTHNTTVTPTDLNTVPQWDSVTVTVSLAYSDVCLLPIPRFLGGKTYTATCILPREAPPN